MSAPITYIPEFFTNTKILLYALQKSLAWVKRDNTPRHEYYWNLFGKPYTYGKGKGQRLYESQPYTSVIGEIQVEVEREAQCKFEVCFLNRYLNQSDQLGWHADDSPEMDDARPIAIVSFGVEREIWFRKSTILAEDGGISQDPSKNPIEKLTLGNGSLCLMHAGMQDLWQHRIPKASFICGERVSLTFRGYTEVRGLEPHSP